MSALSVAEALERILGDVPDGGATETERLPIAACRERILAEMLTAGFDQPPFAASAMDGYAVRSADVAALPARLKVIAAAAAGHPYDGRVGPGEAVRIFTGAPLPEGADAIIIQEDTERDGDWVTIASARPDPEHIRPKAYDFRAGQTLLLPGTRLAPRSLTLAAAMGRGDVLVRRRPRVAVLATGDELRHPGEPLAPGQIYASNHLGVAAMVEQAGGEAQLLGIARDNRESLEAHVAAAADADVLVTIGGASVGDHDLVGPVLTAAGMQLGFWKIAMRPGKPLMYGRLDRRRVIGLPGNPVSSLVCTRVFVVPLIARLLGLPAGRHGTELIPTAVPLSANGPREHYMRARVVAEGAERRNAVHPVRSQDSSLLSPLAEADCLLVRPAGAPAVPAGTPVPVLRLDF
ncbi:MAG: gephyrin-like molybdotransferase Glp [Hyphomicrobiaceae bacterium]